MRTGDANGARTGDAPERYVRLDERLTDELRAIASFPGCEVKDTEAAWRKFCGTYADKWVHVAGKWQAWCTTWAKNERTDRERAATARTGPGFKAAAHEDQREREQAERRQRLAEADRKTQEGYERFKAAKAAKEKAG